MIGLIIIFWLWAAAAVAQVIPPVAPIAPATVPIGNTGTCSTGVTVTGGASSAGLWASTSPCNIGGTIIISSMPSAPNGYACAAADRTTVGVVLQQTGSTKTSATFTVRATNVAANDVVQFGCQVY